MDLKNKRAWVRLLEAFIAIALMASILVYLYTKNVDKPKRAEEIYNFEKTILDEIEKNPNLRNYVLNNNTQELETFIGERVPTGFIFEIRICEIDDICGMSHYEKEVYSLDRIISATLELYNPKKIRIFLWKE